MNGFMMLYKCDYMNLCLIGFNRFLVGNRTKKVNLVLVLSKKNRVLRLIRLDLSACNKVLVWFVLYHMVELVYNSNGLYGLWNLTNIIVNIENNPFIEN